MWAELEALIVHVQDPFIRELLKRMTAEHGEKLRIWPAAQTVHHAYRGGFLEHILSVARSALTLGTAYGANKDLLTAGALLHDIGKLEELQLRPRDQLLARRQSGGARHAGRHHGARR